jgi:surface antigen
MKTMLFVLFRQRGLALPIAVAMLGGSLTAPLTADAQSYGTFGTDRRSCDRSAMSQILSTSKGNLLGSAAGGALGGLLGSQFGKGSGSTLMTIVGVVGGALAGGYVGRSMEPADQACVGQTLEHTPTNETVAWQNPNNGSSYWVTPTSTYQGNGGQPCRNFVTNAVVDGQQQQIDGTACRQPDGHWKTVSTGGQPAPAAGYAPPQQVVGTAVSPDTVFQVQQRLHDTGFYVRDNIDGVWGSKTATALKNFQRAHGLNATGQLDPQTMTALDLPTPPANQAAPAQPTQ